MGIHARNKIAGRVIPFLVLCFWDKNTGICAGHHAISPVFSGHYQDLGISHLKSKNTKHEYKVRIRSQDRRIIDRSCDRILTDTRGYRPPRCATSAPWLRWSWCRRTPPRDPPGIVYVFTLTVKPCDWAVFRVISQNVRDLCGKRTLCGTGARGLS